MTVISADAPGPTIPVGGSKLKGHKFALEEANAGASKIHDLIESLSDEVTVRERLVSTSPTMS